MKVEVSIGEVLDKISILEIKNEKIKDEKKLIHIKHELEELKKELKIENIVVDEKLYEELKLVNRELWRTEDILREKERSKLYDSEFIHNAEMDSVLNDQRFLIKNKINNHYDSNIKEQKSYNHLKYGAK